jgi:hypothetical protein
MNCKAIFVSLRRLVLAASLFLLAGCHDEPAKALVNAPKPGIVGSPHYRDSPFGEQVVFQSSASAKVIEAAVGEYCRHRGLAFQPEPSEPTPEAVPKEGRYQGQSWLYGSPKEDFSIELEPDTTQKGLLEVVYVYKSKGGFRIEF